MVTPGPAEPLRSLVGWGQTRVRRFGEQRLDLGCFAVSPLRRGCGSDTGICDKGFAGWEEEEGQRHPCAGGEGVRVGDTGLVVGSAQPLTCCVFVCCK